MAGRAGGIRERSVSIWRRSFALFRVSVHFGAALGLLGIHCCPRAEAQGLSCRPGRTERSRHITGVSKLEEGGQSAGW